MKKIVLGLLTLGALAGAAWAIKTVVFDPQDQLVKNDSVRPTPKATPKPTPTPVIVIKELPITLPLLDALFFVDQEFPQALKTQLQLNDEQITQLREAAREETANLRESENEAESASTTTAAGQKAAAKVSAILGPEKAPQFAEFVLERWRKIGSRDEDTIALSEEPTPLGTPSLVEISPVATPAIEASPSPSPSVTIAAMAAALLPSGPFAAPQDTRIVVNAPAHRMDIFQNGQLIKSFMIGIGYPEFPLPAGMRKASQIIFNPTWTPPDEPWVPRAKVGQKVAAGDKLNPLGVIKIPIGMPSLIHGGKQPVKIGSFASHGCVGLTDKQVQSFAKVLAQIGGVELTEKDVAKYGQTRTETKVVKLKEIIPVELRYETLAVEDGKLHVYRDVYDRDTTVKANLEALLGTYNLTLADLSEDERVQALAALSVMARKPEAPTSAATLTEAEKAEQRKIAQARQQLLRDAKGRKEIVVEIAALAGKGYPAPVDLDTGGAPKPAPTPTPGKETKAKAK